MKPRFGNNDFEMARYTAVEGVPLHNPLLMTKAMRLSGVWLLVQGTGWEHTIVFTGTSEEDCRSFAARNSVAITDKAH